MILVKRRGQKQETNEKSQYFAGYQLDTHHPHLLKNTKKPKNFKDLTSHVTVA